MSDREQGFYYGWVIVAVMAISRAVTMGMGSLNFGLFIKPMGDQLGIGRADFGWAQTARQASSSVTSPIVGWLLDRYGARIMLPVAVTLTGVSMIGLAYINHAWQLIALFAIMGLVGLSGPGALVTSVPVLKWFVVNRGKAVAFMSLGVPFGALIFIPLTQFVINVAGWEMSWIVLAVIGIGVVVPLTGIFVRRQPEDIGLLPDGAVEQDPVEGDSGAPVPASGEVSWTVSEAMRSTTLWRLVVVFSAVSLATSTVGLHRIPSFMDKGLDPTLISYATAFDAVCAGVSTFSFGMLVRYIPARYLGATGFMMLATASVLTIYANSILIVFISMAVFGLGIGGMMFLQNFIWADYFGRESVGSIRGLVNPINLVVGGLGAPVAGYIHDFTGTYDPAWWVGVGLMVFAALLTVVTPAPTKPVVSVPVKDSGSQSS